MKSINNLNHTIKLTVKRETDYLKTIGTQYFVFVLRFLKLFNRFNNISTDHPNVLLASSSKRTFVDLQLENSPLQSNRVIKTHKPIHLTTILIMIYQKLDYFLNIDYSIIILIFLVFIVFRVNHCLVTKMCRCLDFFSKI